MAVRAVRVLTATEKGRAEARGGVAGVAHAGRRRLGAGAAGRARGAGSRQGRAVRVGEARCDWEGAGGTHTSCQLDSREGSNRGRRVRKRTSAGRCSSAGVRARSAAYRRKTGPDARRQPVPLRCSHWPRTSSESYRCTRARCRCRCWRSRPGRRSWWRRCPTWCCRPGRSGRSRHPRRTSPRRPLVSRTGPRTGTA